MHWMLGYKFSKTKTAPTLGVWGGGGGDMGGRRVAGKPDA